MDALIITCGTFSVLNYPSSSDYVLEVIICKYVQSLTSFHQKPWYIIIYERCQWQQYALAVLHFVILIDRCCLLIHQNRNGFPAQRYDGSSAFFATLLIRLTVTYSCQSTALQNKYTLTSPKLPTWKRFANILTSILPSYTLTPHTPVLITPLRKCSKIPKILPSSSHHSWKR